jgi:hypothetical protein
MIAVGAVVTLGLLGLCFVFIEARRARVAAEEVRALVVRALEGGPRAASHGSNSIRPPPPARVTLLNMGASACEPACSPAAASVPPPPDTNGGRALAEFAERLEAAARDHGDSPEADDPDGPTLRKE